MTIDGFHSEFTNDQQQITINFLIFQKEE